jgi:signal transduction histidine kinase
MEIKSKEEAIGRASETVETSPATNYANELNGVAGAEGETIAGLRRLAEYRSLMIADFAHELRTPLTAILGFAEILVDFEKLTEPQKDLCERIQNSGRELQSTINLLSDLASLDFEDPKIVMREFSLSHTLHELCEAFSRKAMKKKISLACTVDDVLGSVVTDESKLRQMLYNLLGCAIARSPLEGQVNVIASMAGAGELAVKTEDDGEPLDLTRGCDLFGAGVGGDNPTLQTIGLDISQRLAKALGGTITLESREPRGLSIVLLLPTQPASFRG